MSELPRKRRRQHGLRNFVLWLSLALALPSALAQDAARDAVDETQPGVSQSTVHRSVFLGWRVFHSTCHGCHGVDATGTSVAPDLTAAIEEMSPRAFANHVLTGYRIVLESQEALTEDKTAVREAFLELVMRRERGALNMPAWRKDPNVTPHVLDLYAYLRSRADGTLGPGRPRQTFE